MPWLLHLMLGLSGCTPDETGYGDTDAEVATGNETDTVDVPDDSPPGTDSDEPEPTDDGSTDDEETDGVHTDDETDALAPDTDTDTDPVDLDDTDTDTDLPVDTAPTDTGRLDTACGTVGEHNAPCDSGGGCGEDPDRLLQAVSCDNGRAIGNRWGESACTLPSGRAGRVVLSGRWWASQASVFDALTGRRVAYVRYDPLRPFCGGRRTLRWWGTPAPNCTVRPNHADETCGETDSGL